MKTIVFDFDGVIVDSFAVGFASVVALGFDLSREQYLARLEGSLYEAFGDRAKVIDEQDPFWQRYAAQLELIHPFPGMVEVVKLLAATSTLWINSGAPTTIIHRQLERFELQDCFAGVWGCDTDVSKVRKFERLFAEGHADATSTCFVTDTLGDMREAARVGVPTIGVSWGYHPPETLRRGDPLAIIEQPHQLTSYFL